MTDTTAPATGRLSSIRAIAAEWITLCGPCEHLMSFEEYGDRRALVADTVRGWTLQERTECWYLLAELGSDGNVALKPTEGLLMTAENLAVEEHRLFRLVPEDEETGEQEWGWLLYVDVVFGSLDYCEIARFSAEKTRLVFGRAVGSRRHLRAV